MTYSKACDGIFILKTYIQTYKKAQATGHTVQKLIPKTILAQYEYASYVCYMIQKAQVHNFKQIILKEILLNIFYYYFVISLPQDSFIINKHIMLISQSCWSRNLHKKQTSDLSIPDQRVACKTSKNKLPKNEPVNSNNIDNGFKIIDKSKQGQKQPSNNGYTDHRLTHGYRSYSDIKKAYIDAKILNQNKAGGQQDPNYYNFQPHICSKGKMRNFDDFIELQDKFVRNKQQKICRIKTEISDIQRLQNTRTPKIDRKSRKISESLNQDEVFSRLSRQKVGINSKYLQEQMFTPKILNRSKNLRRPDNVGSLLYSDAQRRLSHRKMAQNQSQMPPIPTPPSINTNTNKHVYKKIKNELEQMMEDQQSISPIVAISMISQLFHVDLNPNKNIETQNLCHKVLLYLFQQNKNDKSITTEYQQTFSEVQISKKKLLAFIQAILNFDLRLPCEDDTYSKDRKIEIFNNFGYFYRQRLARQRKLKLVRDQNQTFYPKTLQNSVKMAETHREKKLEQISQFLQNYHTNNIVNVSETLRIQDLFLLDSIRKQAQNQQKRKINQQKQLMECSFRPSLSRKKYVQSKPRCSTDKKYRQQQSSLNQTTPVKQLGQPQQFGCSMQLNSSNCLRQIQYNKLHNQTDISQHKILNNPSMFECGLSDSHTGMKTRINTNIKIHNNQNIVQIKDKQNACKTRKKIKIKHKQREVKDLQKNLLRMSVGRKIRQFEHNYKQRGYVKNQNWISSQQKMKRKIDECDKQLRGYSNEASQRKSQTKVNASMRC